MHLHQLNKSWNYATIHDMGKSTHKKSFYALMVGHTSMLDWLLLFTNCDNIIIAFDIQLNDIYAQKYLQIKAPPFFYKRV